MPDQILRYGLSVLVLYYCSKMCLRLLLERKNFFYKEENNLSILLFLWASVPALSLFIFSELFTPILSIRYIITCLVPLSIISVRGLFTIPNVTIRSIVALTLLCTYIPSYQNWFNIKNKPQFKYALNYVEQNKLKDCNTVSFFNPGYLSIPILFNLSPDKFRASHNTGDILSNLENENIYLYDSEKINQLSNHEGLTDFFVLIDWVGGDIVEKDLSSKPNIYILDSKITNPFTIKHYIPLSPADRILELKLTDNIYQQKGVYYNKDYNTIYPDGYNKRAEIIYKLSPKELTYKNRIFFLVQSYVIFSNNWIKIYSGDSYNNLEILYDYKNTKQGQEFIQKTFDITHYIKRGSEIYIKIELYVDKKTSKTPWDARLEKIAFLLKN